MNENADPKDSGTPAELERSSGDALHRALQAAARDSGLTLVRYTSVRKRLLDSDNACSKFHTDALRYAGILDSDGPDKTTVQTFQRKTKQGEEEHTLLEIFFPD